LIVSLYDRLMIIAPAPVIALNRAIALAQRDGAERGLEELRTIGDRSRLANYPFYPAAFGELELRRGNRDDARQRCQTTLALARNPARAEVSREPDARATESSGRGRPIVVC
jgi:RNA polymerase sigma-70 factor (ECF subfamily)